MIKKTKVIKREIISPEQQFEDCRSKMFLPEYEEGVKPQRNVILDGVAELHTEPFWRVYDYNVRKEIVRKDSDFFEWYDEGTGRRCNLSEAQIVRAKRKALLAKKTAEAKESLEQAISYRKTLDGKWFKGDSIDISDIVVADRQEKFDAANREEMTYRCMTYSPKKITFDTIEIVWHLDVYFYEF